MPSSRLAVPTLALVLAGCPAAVDPTTLPCDSEEAVVELTTADGLRLAADYRPAASEDRGAVVLVHMIPPSNDRSTWPPEVREAIAAEDVTVLTIDRRGAGGSEGIAQEAYEGVGGQLDLEAAMRFLINPELPCGVDSTKIALVGASNGSTSVLDYTIAHDASLPTPAALTWMSPGAYTENQHRIPEHRAVLDQLPILWMYPSSEPYSTGFIADPGPAWLFTELGTAHGTRMFDGGELQDEATTVLTEWVGRWIAP